MSRTKNPAPQDRAFHPIASAFPLLEGGEYARLVEDLRPHGQREPIWLYQEQILDGRNRYRACLEAHIEPTYRPYLGDNPVGFVYSMNVARRHLSPEQKHKQSPICLNVSRNGLIGK